MPKDLSRLLVMKAGETVLAGNDNEKHRDDLNALFKDVEEAAPPERSPHALRTADLHRQTAQRR